MRFCAALLLAAALLGGGFIAAGQRGAPPASAEDSDDSAAPFSPEQLEKIREFSEVYRIVKENYVEEISDEELMNNAIRGMIQGLDPHSSYLSADLLEQFEQSVSAEQYGGVGIYIGQKDGWVEVVSPIDGTPAMRAGLLAGDLILKIDDTSTRDMTIDTAVGLMRGRAGDFVVLEILTPGEEPRKVELRREQITAPTAVAAVAEPDYGYLRVSRFQHETVADTVKAINKLYEDNGRPLRGLVLDLRNNPGGLLRTGIGIASIFLPEGVTVVSDRGREDENHFTAQARRHRGLDYEDEIKNVPMAVLVNNGSASASEIVAGALQDHRRAVIVGSRTYGKASVQSLLRLPSTNKKTGLKLTTARYFTPFNRSIQAVGIEPDINAPAAKSAKAEENSFAQREQDLLRHLENPEAGETNAAESSPEPEKAPFIPQDDNQYDQALVALKALAVAGR